MKASIFITCLVDNFYPDVGESMVRILKSQGVDVDFPEEQVCCGQPAFNSGYWDDAKEVGKTLLRAFKDSQFVVGPSSSCVAMIKENYPLLFKDDPYYKELAEQLVGRVYEFSQFLVEVLGVTDLGAKYPATVTYHPSCHGTRLGGSDGPISLLKKVKKLTLVELPMALHCCGFGGTFSVKMAPISQAMVAEKALHVMESGAEILTGMDMGCLMNIGGYLEKQGSKIKVMHIAQLLDEGMRK